MTRMTIHLGIVANDGNTNAADLLDAFGPGWRVWDETSRLHFDMGHTPSAKPDSFTAWCEQPMLDDALHVTVETDVLSTYADKRRAVAHVRTALTQRLWPGTGASYRLVDDYRLVDYAVVTDRNDWSEDVTIVGRWA